MRLLLDTTVLIDVVRNKKQRRELLADLVDDGHTLTTSALNIAELYSGMRPNEEPFAAHFLGDLEILDVSREIARTAGQLRNSWARKGRTLKLADTIVAATAIQGRYTLATDNRKDFPMSEVVLFSLP